MRRQIMKIEYNGHWIVTHDDKRKTNPYTVYRKWYDNGWHSRKVNAYGDFNSCVCCICSETSGYELRLYKA